MHYIYIEFNSWLIAVAVWPYARCKKSMEIRSLLNFNAHIRTLSSCICMNVDEEGWWWMAEWPFPCFETFSVLPTPAMPLTRPTHLILLGIVENSAKQFVQNVWKNGLQIRKSAQDSAIRSGIFPSSLPSSLFKSITHFGIKLRDVVLYTNPPWSNN